MSSETNPACLLEVDSALETARYRGIAMTIVGIEVWGCGDEEAVESQQKMKNWEKRLILKRQKVIIIITVDPLIKDTLYKGHFLMHQLIYILPPK